LAVCKSDAVKPAFTQGTSMNEINQKKGCCTKVSGETERSIFPLFDAFTWLVGESWCDTALDVYY